MFTGITRKINMKTAFFISLCVACICFTEGAKMGKRFYDEGDSLSKDKQSSRGSKEEEPSPGAFESDMMLTEEQMAAIQDAIERVKGQQFYTSDVLQKRKALRRTTYRWDNGIVPYVISSDSYREEILAGIDHWRQHTCLEFREKLDTDQHYISFIKAGGCWSYVGRIGGEQELSIGNGCQGLGVVAHEIGHAIGFFHEQSRPDRDDHVTVHSQYIQSGRENNFQKYSIDSVVVDVPYDVGSVMHYGTSYFTNTPGQDTITVNNPLEEHKIGNRASLTFADIKLGNLIYSCNADCPDIECLNDGYVGPECSCVCPPRFSGDMCQTEDPEELGCLLEVTDQSGILQSPNFPSDYANNERCGWLITGSTGSTVSLQFEEFNLEADDSCRWDYVQVRKGDVVNGYIAAESTKYCGSTLPDPVESTMHQMFVGFKSDTTIVRKGFKARYEILDGDEGSSSSSSSESSESSDLFSSSMSSSSAVQCEDLTGVCGGYLTRDCGTISSPNYPDRYAKSLQCIWTIETDPGKRIVLSFESLDLQKNVNCKKDYVSINPAVGDLFTIPLRLCGKDAPTGTFVSNGNTMEVTFGSNGDKKLSTGFIAQYYTVEF